MGITVLDQFQREIIATPRSPRNAGLNERAGDTHQLRDDPFNLVAGIA